jgi:hypothetical protein
MSTESVYEQFAKALQAMNEPWGWLSLSVDDLTFHLLLRVGHPAVRELEEARHRGEPIGGKYSAQLHPPHTPRGQKHLHIYAGNNQLFALNMDGTAHDQSHGIQIPGKAATAISKRFPGIRLPPDNYIESVDIGSEADLHLLLESH